MWFSVKVSQLRLNHISLISPNLFWDRVSGQTLRVIVRNSAAASESLRQLFREFEIMVKEGRKETARQVFFEND